MKFFETLPRTLKLLLHIVELTVCLLAATVLALLMTPYADSVKPYVAFVGLGFAIIFPPVHAILEICFGEAQTAPTFTDVVADKMKDALAATLDRATSIEVKTVPKPADDGPSDAKP